MSTLPGCNPATIENAVTVVELQTVSAAPSGSMRKTALRAFATSVRLRLVAAEGCVGSPLWSTAVIQTEVLGVPVSQGCGGVVGVCGGGPRAAACLHASH